MRNSQKGFTLIELLVVIAIIGILATIVLTSLGSAREKANDTKVQGQLSSMRAQAELFYSTTGGGSYGTATATTDCSAGTLYATGNANNLFTLHSTLPTGYTKTCHVTPTTGTGNIATAWAVTSSRGTAMGWCVDSTGQSKTYTGTAATAPVAAVCQ